MTPFEFGVKIAAELPKPTFAPPTQPQLDAFKQHIIGQGFHPSVASEQLSAAQHLGMDKAMQGFSDLQKRYPVNDGVQGTAAVASRQYYFNNLNNNYRGQYGGKTPMPQYPEKLQKIPQIGTTTPAAGIPPPKPPKPQARPRVNLIRGTDGELRVRPQ